MAILVTGAAGFIGSHLIKKLLSIGETVIGIDNINDYYEKELKINRIKSIKKNSNFSFFKINLSKKNSLLDLNIDKKVTTICHLAAQAGVRFSIENPHAYIESNINGYLEVLEYCRLRKVSKLVYASSSSVYGGNKKIPFSIEDSVNNPLSIYAATKRSNELMSQSYANLFKIPMIGLRFFTVYGPWGRPDMAIWKFTEAIYKGKPIKIYNHGKMKRDFTYISDIVKGILAAIHYRFNNKSNINHNIYNLGNNKPITIMKMIKIIEKNTGLIPEKEYLPMQPGDAINTFADIEASKRDLGFNPLITPEDGIKNFINWYKDYYKIK